MDSGNIWLIRRCLHWTTPRSHVCHLKLIILSSRRKFAFAFCEWVSEIDENEWQNSGWPSHVHFLTLLNPCCRKRVRPTWPRGTDRIYCYYFLTTGTPSTKKWRSKKSNTDCMASLGSPSCSSELKTFLSLPLNWSGGLGEQSTSTNDALWYIHIKFLAFSHISVHGKHTNKGKYLLLLLSATPDHFQSASYREAKQT